MRKVLTVIPLIFSAFLCFSVCACGGSADLVSKAMYSERGIVLPVKANLSVIGADRLSGWSTYQSNRSLKEILPSVSESGIISSYKSSDSLDVSGKGEYLLLERAAGDGTIDYFSLIVTQKISNKKFYYLFNSLRAEVFYEAENGEQKSFQTLFPYHLVPDLVGSARIYMSVEYAVNAELEDFYEFYERSGWFDLEKDSSFITVKGFKRGVTVSTENAELPFSFRLSFRNYLNLKLLKIERA